MPGPLYEGRYKLTGKWRLSPCDNHVRLQVQEAKSYPSFPDERWRDATPQEVMSLVTLEMRGAKLPLVA